MRSQFLEALLIGVLFFPMVAVADPWVIELSGDFDFLIEGGEPLVEHDPPVPVRVLMTFDNGSASAAGQQYVLDDLLHAEIESDLLPPDADVRLVGQIDLRVLPDGTIDRHWFYAHLGEDATVPGSILQFSSGFVGYQRYGAPEGFFFAQGTRGRDFPALEVLPEPTTSAGLAIGAAALLLLRRSTARRLGRGPGGRRGGRLSTE